MNWKERNYKKEIGKYTYEILVSEGPFNETTAQVFETNQPPFVYSNATANNYTFALRVKTELGYQSSLSPRYGAIVLKEGRNAATDQQNSATTTGGGTNLTAILVPTFLLVIVLSVILVWVVLRHQKLQNSFTRFANSHYDSRSGAATFDDHSLEEDDTPQFHAFSDDEPLVIA